MSYWIKNKDKVYLVKKISKKPLMNSFLPKNNSSNKHNKSLILKPKSKESIKNHNKT